MHTGLLLLALLLSLAPWAWSANTHGTTDPSAEMRAWAGDSLTPYVASGCRPSIPGSGLALLAVACTAYVPGPAGALTYVAQSAHDVAPFSGGDGVYWLAVHADTTTALGGWTRTPGTHYVWSKAATPPAAPSNALIVSRVSITAGALSGLTNLAPRPRLERDPWVYHIEDYGAVCDGQKDSVLGTDDAVALQAALSAVMATGGTLHFPPRICLTSAQLEMTGAKGVVLRGAGATFIGAGQRGSWLKLTTARTALLHSGSMTNIRIEGLGFDGNFLADNVLFYESASGPVSWVEHAHIIVDRPVLTTGNGVLLGGAINSEVDWISFDHCLFYGDSQNAANSAATMIKLVNSNTLWIDVKRSFLGGADNLLYALSGAFGNITSNILSYWGSNAIVISTALETVIDSNYTEHGAGVFVNFTHGSGTLHATGPVRVSYNAMRTGGTSMSINACFPLVLEGNQFSGTVGVATAANCEGYRVTATNNSFSSAGMVPGGGFVGAGAGLVDELNTVYYDTTGLTHVEYSRFPAGLLFGSGSTKITYLAMATFALTIPAPGAVPGCSDSAEQTLAGVLTAGRLVTGSLTDGALPAGGQLTVYASSSGKVKFRWCQFAGAAVSPDGGVAKNYTAQVWAFQ